MRWLVVLAVLVLAVAAEAKTPIYFGLGGGELKLQVNGNDGESVSGYGLVGIELAPWVSLELRAGTGAKSDRFGLDPFNSPALFITHTRVAADNYASALLKLRINETGRLRFYALAGGTDATVTSTVDFSPVTPGGGSNSFSFRKNKSGLSTGIGAEAKLGDRWSVRGEYLRLFDSVEIGVPSGNSLQGSASIGSYSAALVYRL